ncbi:MAG: type II toxin-antitoxin system RelE/ParE family toxin [Nitrospirae bacterium]|nr:type II toxin-antitoxin system RelE/ParE family toxin [Nitrospirota bacterium]MBF0534852.1 type II toxin-antitoxin system RelE/ParE family toxin [Nitrospirota bacterium]MBF0616767.1 type II toxin-antitoxin system RelE/ParE family toxin [Nitrospirota bacterium]
MSTEKELNRAFGKNAKELKRRLAVLSAAPTLEDVPHTPPQRRHELAGDRKYHYAVDLNHPYRLVFEIHNKPPLRVDGSVDLGKVTAITIIGVEDYH